MANSHHSELAAGQEGSPGEKGGNGLEHREGRQCSGKKKKKIDENCELLRQKEKMQGNMLASLG